MIRNPTLAEWATLYGVTFHSHRLNWWEWVASMKRGPQVLWVTVHSFTRPPPEIAFSRLQADARMASLCGGEFEAWLSRQPLGKPMPAYLDAWDVLEGARGRLIGLVGEAGMQRFLSIRLTNKSR